MIPLMIRWDSIVALPVFICNSLAQLLFNIVIVGEPCTSHFHFSYSLLLCKETDFLAHAHTCTRTSVLCCWCTILLYSQEAPTTLPTTDTAVWGFIIIMCIYILGISPRHRQYKIFHFGDTTHAPTHTMSLSRTLPDSLHRRRRLGPFLHRLLLENFPFEFPPPNRTFRQIFTHWSMPSTVAPRITINWRPWPLKSSAHSSAFSVRREKPIFSSYWIGEMGGRQNLCTSI